MSGKIVTLQDRTDNYVPIYPVTSPKAVIDSLTGETLEETNQQKDLAITGLQANKYVICNTASAIGAKIIANPNFVLDTTAHLIIKFDCANTVDAVTLNVNNTGDMPVYYNDSRVSSINTWQESEVCNAYFNGSAWMLTMQSSEFICLTATDYATLVSMNMVEPNKFYCILEED